MINFRDYFHSYRQLASLGLPIVAGQAGLILVGFADNIMVGRYSTDALASASFVNNVFNIALLTCMGFTYGVTPLVGALFGRGEKEPIGKLLRNAMVLNIIFALVIMAVMIGIYEMLPYLGQPEQLLPLIRPYYKLVLASIVPLSIFNVFAQWSYGIKNSVMPVWIVLGANVFNVIGNYLLIYGHFGFAEMGLTGAGIATLISRIIGPAIIVGIFFMRRKYRSYHLGFVHARVDRRSLRRIFLTSFPIAIQLGCESGSFTIAAVMAGWLGAIELAAFQVMVVVGQLGFCFYYSLGTATSVLVANAAGTSDHHAMRRIGFAGYHLTLLMAVAASLTFWLAGRPLISLFTADPAVIATALSLIGPLILYQIADATQVNFSNALRGTSKVMSMLWISFFSYVVVGIPVTYLLGFTCELGIYGIFLSFSVSLLIAASLFLYFFMHHTRPLTHES